MPQVVELEGVEKSEWVKPEEARGENERAERNDRYGRRTKTVCWVCGTRLDKYPHTEGRPCRNIGINCTECKNYGHLASCHMVQDKEAQEALSKTYGTNYTFITGGGNNSSKKRSGSNQDQVGQSRYAKIAKPNPKLLDSDKD